MYNFDYHRPKSVADAVAALKKASDGKLIAGGQTLIPTLKQRLAQPSDLIDLSGVAELQGIKVDGKTVTIGAMTKHAEVANSTDVARTIPALSEMAKVIGDPQVRNVGTLGGSIANADPAADYPAAVLGLGATVQTDRRTIAGDDFFQGLFTTALEPGELIVSVAFPIAQRAAYAKLEQPASRFALAGVMASQGPAGVRVAVTGARSHAFRVSEMEQALSKDFRPESIEGIRIDAAGCNSDLHGSAEYRAAMVTVLARRAVERALAR